VGKNNVIIIALLTLIIGGGIGYYAGMSRPESISEHHAQTGMMGGAMSNMMSGLEGRQGDAFDKAFLAEMIVHHEGAVAMAEAALGSAKHDEIQQMAQSIITAQNAEIAQMQGWQTNWYGVR